MAVRVVSLGCHRVPWGGSPPPPPVWAVAVGSVTRVVSVVFVVCGAELDLLSASLSDSKVAWYRSSGSTPTFTEQVVSTTACISASGVQAVDFEGDGTVRGQTDGCGCGLWWGKGEAVGVGGRRWGHRSLCPIELGVAH